ncbi:DUF4177 domain-containing protein [Imperialibacter roseus]|uniref:DUF4177 domain-containing protein n=1 Tax=Imperialibacter roseus TaxID=1324217 RepID=A0ABZ0ITB0_9BACT|nr:DUF4177 domain-containing protein [Imperialibacter roseus]WOK08268.1 DUF4177 domain-containing protein [Imperialibacter roseus]
MQKFEYKIVTISVAHLKKKDFQSELSRNFDEWGAEGWDLVKFEPVLESWFLFNDVRTKEFIVVFKREKSSGRPHVL